MHRSCLLLALLLISSNGAFGALRGDAPVDPALPAESQMRKLLEPMPSKEFFEQYYDNKAVHIRPDAAAAATSLWPERVGLFDRAQLDKILTTQKIYNEISTRFVIEDQDIDASEQETHGENAENYDDIDSDTMVRATSVVTPDIVDKHLSKKATMVFKHLEMHSPELKKMTCMLANSFGARSGVNMYLTPPETTGFLTHYDGHDLFVVQTAGSKCWQVCERAEDDKLRTAGAHFPGVNATRLEAVLGVTCRNLTLAKGEVLYLPRGTLHAPHTHECTVSSGATDVPAAANRASGEHSLHVSFSVDVRASQWASLISNIVQQMELGETVDEPVVSGKGEFSDHHWSWRILGEEVMLNLTASKSALGQKLRNAFPMWTLRLQQHAEAHNVEIFGGKGFAHGKVWKKLKGIYDEIIESIQANCAPAVQYIVTPTLMAYGHTEKEAEENAASLASACGEMLGQILSGNHQSSSVESFDFGVAQLLVQNVQANNMKCAGNSPVIMGIDQDEGLGTGAEEFYPGDVLDSFDGGAHVDEHSLDKLGDGDVFGGAVHSLKASDRVQLHAGLSLALFPDPKGDGAVLAGPFMEKSMSWSESNNQALLKILQEVGPFNADKHSFDVLSALHEVGALEVSRES